MVESEFPNPFADFNANYMSDDEILKYWVKPELLFELEAIGIDLHGKIPVVIKGGRGTGKTMLLRYLSFEPQMRDYVKLCGSPKGFLDETSYLGVYHRFDGPKLSSFSNKNVESTIWDTVFLSFFELIVGQKYLSLLNHLHDFGVLRISSETESSLCHTISENLFETSTVSTLLDLKQLLVKLQRELERFTEKSTFRKIDFMPSEVIIRGSLMFDLIDIICDYITELKNKNFILLLDEYENLTLSQQKIINTFIKHTKLPVTFRLGMRIKGFRTYETLNENEFLREGADFRRIIFENFLISKNDKYRELAKNIANRRLELHPELSARGFTSIDSILGKTPSPEDEARLILQESRVNRPHFRRARKIIESSGIHKKAEIESMLERISFPENPLIEMLNILLLARDKKIDEITSMMDKFIKNDKSSPMYHAYKHLYNKNKVALLFHLANDCGTTKRYYGFEAFCMLSSGIIRSFLELCYHTFNYGIFYERENLIINGKIDWNSQHKGSLKESSDFFDWIRSIPKFGSKLTLFIDSLGALFKTLHYSDKRISEPEQTYFDSEYDSLTQSAQVLLDTAVMWSTLQERDKAMEEREPHDILPDVYAINRILAPRYRISYRTRGRTKIQPPDLEILLMGSEEEKRQIIKKYSKEPFQKKLFDVVNQGK